MRKNKQIRILLALAIIVGLTACDSEPVLGPTPVIVASPGPSPSPTPRVPASCLIEGDRIVFGIGAKQERELRLRVFDAERTVIPNVFGTWNHNGPIQRIGPREGPTFAYWAVTAGVASVAVTLPGTPGCQFEITIEN